MFTARPVFQRQETISACNSVRLNGLRRWARLGPTGMAMPVRRQIIWDRCWRDLAGLLASSGWSILSDEHAVKRAAMFNSFLFDAVSFAQNRLAPAEVDVRRG